MWNFVRSFYAWCCSCFRELTIFWDVLTGNTERKPCRSGMFNRTEWVGQTCSGIVLALEVSPNRNFIVMGSEDGYMFIYSAETGMPREKEKPATKHSAEVGT